MNENLMDAEEASNFFAIKQVGEYIKEKGVTAFFDQLDDDALDKVIEYASCL